MIISPSVNNGIHLKINFQGLASFLRATLFVLAPFNLDDILNSHVVLLTFIGRGLRLIGRHRAYCVLFWTNFIDNHPCALVLNGG